MKRRDFIKNIGLISALGLIDKSQVVSPAIESTAFAASIDNESRSDKIRKVREKALKTSLRRKFPTQSPNQDAKTENGLYIYTKALEHNFIGEVESSSFSKFKKALKSKSFKDFENLELGGPKKLKNPLAGMTFDLQGADPSQFKCPAAPLVNSAITASEMKELYWMALSRDISFLDYSSNSSILAACSELSSSTKFGEPRDGDLVTPDFIFRGNHNSALTGPAISQFLFKDCPIGSLTLSQKQQTTNANVDYLTEESIWLRAQNGFSSFSESLDSTPRYIRNGRDLARFFHIDRLITPFVHAALILQFGMDAPRNSGNPYPASATMDGFGNFDYPHIQELLSAVACRALRAAWYQKWFVHKRLRPEELAGRIHMIKTAGKTYEISEDMLDGEFLNRSFARFNSYLLPMAYPEGAPLHPAYPSGHATVAGACATILKAWFNENFPFSNPVVASTDGLSLVDYQGSDAGTMTVGSEISKLAYNSGMARCWAGVHYRSDIEEGILLGENVALAFLTEIKYTFPEKVSLSFKRFNGKGVRIRN